MIRNWNGSGARWTLLGDIKIGEKVKNTKGVEYPRALDHFLCPPEVLEATIALATERGDEENAEAARQGKPRTLHITVPFGDVDKVLPHAYKLYGSGAGLKCMGDGLWIMRRGGDHNSDPPGVTNGYNLATMKPEPCDRLTCPHAQTTKRRKGNEEMIMPGPCQPRGYLHFIVWNVWRTGVYRLKMSKLAIIQALGQFEIANRLFYRIDGLPYLLHLTQKNEQTPNGMKPLWVPWMEVDPLYVEANVSRVRQALSAPTRRALNLSSGDPVPQLVDVTTGEVVSDDGEEPWGDDAWLTTEEPVPAQTRGPESVPITAAQAADELYGPPPDDDFSAAAAPTAAAAAPPVDILQPTGPSNGKKRATVETPRWTGAMQWICQHTPHYLTEGKPNNWHMLAAAYKLGYEKITDENVKAVADALVDYAHESDAAEEAA